jgi:hypothetical protein
MEVKLRDLEKQMAKAGVIADQGVKRIERSFAAANPKLPAAFTKNLSGIFAGISAGAAASAFREAVATLGDLADASQRLGASTDFLQAFGYAVQMTGGSADAAVSGLEKFAKGLSEAGAGTGKLKEVLDANNVALRDNAGNLLSVEQMVSRYADLIRNARSPQDALNLAVIAFGRSAGPDMVNALRDGAEGLQRMSREAEDAGIIIKRDIIDKGAELDDTFTRLGKIADAWVKSLAVSLANDLMPALPVLEKLLGYMQAINAFAENPFKLGQGLRQLIEGQAPTKIGEIGLQGGSGTKLGDASDFYDALGFPEPLRVNITKPTVMPRPGGGGGRRRGGGGGGRRDNSKEVIADLQLELEKVQAVGAARDEILTKERVLQELRHANVDALSAEGQKIEELVKAIDEAAREQERIAQLMQDFRSVAESGVGSLVDDLMNGVDAAEALENSLKNMLSTIAQIAQRQLLESIFGGGGGAGLGGLFSGIFGGARASGGPISAGKAYLVGEHGPEMVVPKGSGYVVPNHALGGGGGSGVNVSINNYAGVEVSQQTSRTPNGTDIKVVIERVAADSTVTPGSPMNRALRTSFGARPALTRR